MEPASRDHDAKIEMSEGSSCGKGLVDSLRG